MIKIAKGKEIKQNQTTGAFQFYLGNKNTELKLAHNAPSPLRYLKGWSSITMVILA